MIIRFLVGLAALGLVIGFVKPDFIQAAKEKTITIINPAAKEKTILSDFKNEINDFENLIHEGKFANLSLEEQADTLKNVIDSSKGHIDELIQSNERADLTSTLSNIIKTIPPFKDSAQCVDPN
ncbi:MAG: hypothetical protein COV31_01150 [Candidatus Yanofskybacteria bacterium CG10_big_fil_rev_8_21_14_0_10_46_23]|uniref:Uncharacterized protein n=1 Tax=Candidatus Yanofskybacteria bacterium CG10_big_fil_rev_8_21_14_0_10_46_23 TaxID=1975098 RepID=A0A2H0R605_9BACT|nr:MAG: hypothetical protein COV31_01150 [Candidatus Yanofskybacteria bacterium CG10_big_fil_rev_8_21_14_0_10_46_23]